MFQFSRLALFRVLCLQHSGLSHSEIFGLTVVCTYPKLIAAYHVLHRLSMPRHPPYALIRFKYCMFRLLSVCGLTKTLLFYLTTCSFQVLLPFRTNCFPNMSKNFSLEIPEPKFQIPKYYCDVYGLEPLTALPVSYILLTLIITPLSWSPLLNSSLREKSGGYRSRTDDPLRARQVL